MDHITDICDEEKQNSQSGASLLSGCNPITGSGILLALVLAGLASMLAPVHAAQFASHRATYAVELRPPLSLLALQAIEGRTVFSLRRDCDGWRFTEDHAITYSFDQYVSNFILHYESWESFSGDEFSFSMRENATTMPPGEYNGFARLDDGKGEVWFFEFSDGTDAPVALPEGTLFPMTHLRAVLKEAAAGKTSHFGSLFVGGRRDDSIFNVSTIIGKPVQRDPGPVLGALGQPSYRPLDIAYYIPDAIGAEPEYAIEFRLQENGVIRQFVTRYSTFDMKATLLDITALEDQDC